MKKTNNLCFYCVKKCCEYGDPLVTLSPSDSTVKKPGIIDTVSASSDAHDTLILGGACDKYTIRA